MIYAMSDFHLPSSNNKSMDIFGWGDHVKEIRENWPLSEDDTIIMPGDLSWGMNIHEVIPDFEFLESLPGRKILTKGNHDLWWNSKKKVDDALKDFPSISVVHNNHMIVDGKYICGTRGWRLASKKENEDDKPFLSEGDAKIINRELIRLRLSIDSAIDDGASIDDILVFLHFPPIIRTKVCDSTDLAFHNLFKKYGITDVYFGHLHGASQLDYLDTYENIHYHLVSSDYLKFKPIKIQ